MDDILFCAIAAGFVAAIVSANIWYYSGRKNGDIPPEDPSDWIW